MANICESGRGAAVEVDVGRYFVVDLKRNVVAYSDVDLEQLGRELGVLQPWEKLNAA